MTRAKELEKIMGYELYENYKKLSPERQKIARRAIKAIIDRLLAEQENPTSQTELERDLDAIREQQLRVVEDVDKIQEN